jgi:hypothetical protein
VAPLHDRVVEVAKDKCVNKTIKGNVSATQAIKSGNVKAKQIVPNKEGLRVFRHPTPELTIEVSMKLDDLAGGHILQDHTPDHRCR